MNNTLSCPHCCAKLRIPDVHGKRYIRCGACKYVFEIPRSSSMTTGPTMRRDRPLWIRAAIALAIFVAIIISLVLIGRKPNPIITKKLITPAKWTTISYDDLLDKSQLTHQSGEPLSDLLKIVATSAAARGAVQPFLGYQASLLIDVADMIYPSSGAPWIHLGDYFESGSEQPAWAALMRGGEVVVAATGDGRVRVFVPGADPRAAYQSCYSIVRHALAEVLSQNGHSLSVEIFAFENNYADCELRLNEVPYVFEASSFPPPAGKCELDLAGLEQLLQEEAILEGGSLSKDEGLVLFGRKSEPQTLAGRPVKLADLAVAYRAVFHAGDNTAFISLDPNLDPTKVTVNFGGYLEDTAIGAVVLEADKRFKTLATGLDANTFRDLRNAVRTAVPGFETSSELEAKYGSASQQSGWEGTRFWFYPESVRVETDFDGLYARIVNSQFTADAERIREDDVDASQFEALKKRQLSPHIRRIIDDLNANYPKYASIFPELRELLLVGRFIGLMSWLNGISDLPVDLDALLAVPLPPFRTERERTQLLSATVSQVESSLVPVSGRAIVTNLTPILDATIGGHFRDTNSLVAYLALQSGGNTNDSRLRLQEAERILQDHSRDPVRSLIKNEEDLKALVSEAAHRTNAPEPEFVFNKKAELSRLKSRVLALKEELEQLRSIMDRNPEAHNRNLDYHNRLVEENNSLLKRHNSLVAELNASDLSIFYIAGIGGGISLRPKEFSIVKRTGSPLVAEMREKAMYGMTELPKTAPLGSWVRTRKGVKKLSSTTPMVTLKAVALASKSISNMILGEWELNNLGRYWQAKEIGEGGWRDQINRKDGTKRERFYNPSDGTLHIVERSRSGSSKHFLAKRESGDRIKFTSAPQQTVLDPGTPPFWYEKPAPIKWP